MVYTNQRKIKNLFLKKDFDDLEGLKEAMPSKLLIFLFLKGAPRVIKD